MLTKVESIGFVMIVSLQIKGNQRKKQRENGEKEKGEKINVLPVGNEVRREKIEMVSLNSH